MVGRSWNRPPMALTYMVTCDGLTMFSHAAMMKCTSTPAGASSATARVRVIFAPACVNPDNADGVYEIDVPQRAVVRAAVVPLALHLHGRPQLDRHRPVAVDLRSPPRRLAALGVFQPSSDLPLVTSERTSYGSAHLKRTPRCCWLAS